MAPEQLPSSHTGFRRHPRNDLRYNFVSILKSNGCPEAIARSIMGHASVEVSAIYTQIDAESEKSGSPACRMLWDNRRIAGVQLTEGELVIKIDRDEQIVADSRFTLGRHTGHHISLRIQPR